MVEHPRPVDANVGIVGVPESGLQADQPLSQGTVRRGGRGLTREHRHDGQPDVVGLCIRREKLLYKSFIHTFNRFRTAVRCKYFLYNYVLFKLLLTF